ncbi:lysozyme [Burkholderia stagnalis]
MYGGTALESNAPDHHRVIKCFVCKAVVGRDNAQRERAIAGKRKLARELTQAQFAELVSYTYNADNTGVLSTLHSANQNNDAGVVSHMSQRVYIHPRDAQGRRLAPVRSTGFVNRLRLEAAPFQPKRTR